ncbi:MAG: type VI secretion system contractile sheath large subunit [Planctomycetaceae bacterium]
MERGSLQTQPNSLPVSEAVLESESADSGSESGLLQWLIAGGVTDDTRSGAGPASQVNAARGNGWLRSLHTGSPLELMRLWLNLKPGDNVDIQRIKRCLARDIARIDQLLSAQLNEILHAPAFQELESGWRGLYYLWQTRRKELSTGQLDDEEAQILIRVLSVSKRELKKNFEAAGEFDQNELFRKVYEEEFGVAGGEPYGALIANYEFTNHPEDIDLLTQLSEVGAAAFAPVITGASPSLLGLDDFSVLEQTLDLHRVMQQPRHLKWRSLRGRVDSQFLGMTLPRILMRAPYHDSSGVTPGFRFTEEVGDGTRKNFLWGSAAWAMGAVLIRAFATSGWFADIRGAERGRESGGMVAGPAVYEFQTDSRGVSSRSTVEVAISDSLEADLCSLGFVPLSHCKDTDYSVFYSNQSVHAPQVFSDSVASANAKISAMLQYVMCCSRIAHYIKIKVREKLGAAVRPEKVCDDIKAWLVDYVTSDERASPEMKARYPLREADVSVEEVPGKPGEFSMTLRLLPHYQLDQLTSSMTLLARRVEFKQ